MLFQPGENMRFTCGRDSRDISFARREEELTPPSYPLHLSLDPQWQAATGDFFAKLCETCETDESSKGRGLDRSNMDFDVKPKDNFYLYSNGNWMKNNPIPDEYPTYSQFVDENESKLKERD